MAKRTMRKRISASLAVLGIAFNAGVIMLMILSSHSTDFPQATLLPTSEPGKLGLLMATIAASVASLWPFLDGPLVKR